MKDTIRQVYLYEEWVLKAKVALEEETGNFRVHTWLPENGSESAARVTESFETYSAALACMFENAFKASLQYSNLRMYGRMRSM